MQGAGTNVAVRENEGGRFQSEAVDSENSTVDSGNSTVNLKTKAVNSGNSTVNLALREQKSKAAKRIYRKTRLEVGK